MGFEKQNISSLSWGAVERQRIERKIPLYRTFKRSALGRCPKRFVSLLPRPRVTHISDTSGKFFKCYESIRPQSLRTFPRNVLQGSSADAITEQRSVYRSVLAPLLCRIFTVIVSLEWKKVASPSAPKEVFMIQNTP